jgi:tRNA pseudouridine55 synthase
LGVKTASGDSQGEVLTSSEVIVTQEKVESCLAAFRGEIIQVPSMYSALKHQGVPLYKLARKGQEVERKERTVNISRLEMMDFRGDEIDLEIDCSKGTYIRSIADDLGDMLGIGGHVTVLRRLASGPFKVEESISIETLQQEFDAGGPSALDRYLQPADLTVQGLEKVDMPASTAEYVRQGQPVIARGLPTEGKVRLYADGEFFGIGKILDDGRVAPVRLLNTR